MRNNSLKLFLIWTRVSGGMSFKDISYPELWQTLCSMVRNHCSMERNHLCNFHRVHDEEQSCEIILYLDQ